MRLLTLAGAALASHVVAVHLAAALLLSSLATLVFFSHGAVMVCWERRDPVAGAWAVLSVALSVALAACGLYLLRT